MRHVLSCVVLTALLPALAGAQTDQLAWDHAINSPRADRFELSLDGGKTWTVNLGVPPHTVGATVLTYITPMPSVPAGSTLAVRACDVSGCSGPSNTLTIGSPPPPPPPCTTLSELPSVFVTRWEHTTGLPGSRFRLNFQLGGPVPITDVEARIAGVAGASLSGTDLREAGGIWLTTPVSGRYPVSVWVRGSNGCTKEAAALVDLVVK